MGGFDENNSFSADDKTTPNCEITKGLYFRHGCELIFFLMDTFAAFVPVKVK